jgi:hypothetical protein
MNDGDVRTMMVFKPRRFTIAWENLRIWVAGRVMPRFSSTSREEIANEKP